ncbi:MAG: bifunctional oligoribonuclease/PAP phosphatase NrnA [Candidatus Omnitrophica bacterium]|nr:bifunctional oligoribonuclease/PAP phosphatase NrnA [Candidatus Omnitrophota bacterium]
MAGIKEICDNIRKHKKFLITAHTNLEGDALGSELAFYALVKKMGKRAVIVNHDDVPANYRFLPRCGEIRLLGKGACRIDFDCMAVLDCADLKRSGDVWKLNASGRTVLNIDHHISNSGFGDARWVDARASSCSEMIYRIYKRLRVRIEQPEAVAMYAGMMTDTGSFRYANTTAFTHRACADLVRYVDVPLIYRYAYEDFSVAEAKLLVRLLPGIKFASAGKIAYFKLRRGDLKGVALSMDLGDYLLSFARAVKGVEAAVLFKEVSGPGKGSVRINLRSRGMVDVNKAATAFGGGGHKNAAGCTLTEKIDDISEKVVSFLRREVK